MFETILNKYAINQVAYVVEDLEKAAKAHSELFGSGPFLYMDPITPVKATYQGKDIKFTMKTAYAQHGNLQIELIQVLDGVNPYFEEGKYGFHHFSIWVDDPEEAKAHFKNLGFEPSLLMESGGGLTIAYMDCVEKWGHQIEIHAPIQGMWDMVKQAAEEWDGADPYRKFGS